MQTPLSPFTLHSPRNVLCGRVQLGVRPRSPVFLYVFDEAWTLGVRCRDVVSAVLGTTYDLFEDARAWSVPASRGRGWPPHRGVFDRLDVVARQIQVYGGGKPEISEESRAWAAATTALLARGRP